MLHQSGEGVISNIGIDLIISDLVSKLSDKTYNTGVSLIKIHVKYSTIWILSHAAK